MSIENTEKTVEQNPELFMLQALVSGGDIGSIITDQEAKGQKELSQSQLLPTEGIDDVGVMLRKYGGDVFDPVQGDEIFTHVRLPEGWKIKPFEGSPYHSNLVDSIGRKRAFIYYNAAFYDRSACIKLLRRFDSNPYLGGLSPIKQGEIIDRAGIVKFRTPEISGPQALDTVEEILDQFLDSNYPEWRSPFAYWEEVEND